jgi:hypothetical protein
MNFMLEFFRELTERGGINPDALTRGRFVTDPQSHAAMSNQG